MIRVHNGLVGLLLLSAVGAVQYGYNHVTVRQDPKIVAANFGDVDIDLCSPYFLNPEGRQPGFPKGTQGPTSHEDMEAFIENIASRNTYMTYFTANFTSEELRSFPYIRLSSCDSGSCSRPRADKKVRVWLQAAAHGNEPAGDESLLALLGKFDTEPKWAAEILEKVELVILPRYNPDGVFYFQRTLATNFDPNRDHIKLAREQTRQIKQLFSKFNPHVVADMHEYGATTQYGRYNHGSDGLFSAAKNLNINEDIRKLSEELFAKKMGDAMEDAGLRWEPYVTGSSSTDPDYTVTFSEAGTDAKIGRNAMGLTQAIVFLIETRGIFLADQEFQRRTASGLTMAAAVIQTAADNAQEVYDRVEGGRDDFVNSDDEIVISDYTELSKRTFTMVDSTNGSVVQAPIFFRSTTPVTANLTRSRPDAYLIPAGWADLAERLRVGGLEVKRLGEFSGTVETYTITSTSFASGYYQGAVRVTATAEIGKREVTLPAGSFRVSTKQKNAALAFIALEPESIDSYVTFNIVPVVDGDQLPYYRIPA